MIKSCMFLKSVPNCKISTSSSHAEILKCSRHFRCFATVDAVCRSPVTGDQTTADFNDSKTFGTTKRFSRQG